MKWINSNQKHPDKDGLYYIKDTAGLKTLVVSIDKHWYSYTGHPVKEWLEENEEHTDNELEGVEGILKNTPVKEDSESKLISDLIEHLPEYGIDTSDWEYKYGDCCYGGAVEFLARCIKGDEVKEPIQYKVSEDERLSTLNKLVNERLTELEIWLDEYKAPNESTNIFRLARLLKGKIKSLKK